VRYLVPALALALALALAACSADHGSAVTHPDGAPVVGPDADTMFCDAPANSAHVSLATSTGTVGFTSVHAGGTISGGDVAPVAAPPMSLLVVFVDQTRVSEQTIYECSAPNQGCPYDGIVGRVDCIDCNGDGLGPHPVTLQSLSQDLTVQGTLTVSEFSGPLYPATGHITGSISTPDASIVGTFDNDLCALLITETI
jgi:hypothetical protein